MLPYRNPLDGHERAMAKFGSTPAAEMIGKLMAKAAKVEDVGARWRLVEEPSFDNQIGTLT